jgi:hypothetical protein
MNYSNQIRHFHEARLINRIPTRNKFKTVSIAVNPFISNLIGSVSEPIFDLDGDEVTRSEPAD